jgi:hypothetical protein
MFQQDNSYTLLQLLSIGPLSILHNRFAMLTPLEMMFLLHKNCKSNQMSLLQHRNMIQLGILCIHQPMWLSQWHKFLEGNSCMFPHLQHNTQLHMLHTHPQIPIRLVTMFPRDN